MAMVLECSKCKKKHRYYEDEITTLGTMLNPIWITRCPHCGEKSTYPEDASVPVPTKKAKKNDNLCPICKPNIAAGRYFLPDGSSKPFYGDEAGILHNPDCAEIKD